MSVFASRKFRARKAVVRHPLASVDSLLSTWRKETMAEKLNTGDMFPGMTIDLVDGTKLDLPGGIEAKYRVILFYRGHW